MKKTLAVLAKIILVTLLHLYSLAGPFHASRHPALADCLGRPMSSATAASNVIFSTLICAHISSSLDQESRRPKEFAAKERKFNPNEAFELQASGLKTPPKGPAQSARLFVDALKASCILL